MRAERAGLLAAAFASALAFALGLGCTGSRPAPRSPTATSSDPIPCDTSTATPTRTFTDTRTRTPAGSPTPTGVAVGHLLVAGGYTGLNSITTACSIGEVHDNGDVLNWTSGPALPQARAWAALAISSPGGFVYLAGGDDGTSGVSTTYSGKVVAGVGVGAWSASTPLPAPVADSAWTSNGAGRLFLVGGRPAHAGGSSTTAAIAGTFGGGTIGGWTSGSALPSARSSACLVHEGGFLFALGGQAGSASVARSPLVGGMPGPWTIATPSSPVAANSARAFATANRIFYAGGLVGLNFRAHVFSAPVDPGGNLGLWSNSAQQLPTPVAGHASLFVPSGAGGLVFLTGGASLSGAQASVYYATFSGGSLGAWNPTASLPAPLQAHVAAFE